MEALFREGKHAIRALARSPGLALVAIATIGLGVGITTHTFSVVYGTVVRGLPSEDGRPLLWVSGTIPADGITGRSLSIHDYADLTIQQSVLTGTAAYVRTSLNLADDTGPPERYPGALVSASLFQETSVTPALGRGFTEDEEHGLGSPVVVLSHRLWQRRYGGRPDIVGQVVRANGVNATVVGIMPRRYFFPFNQQVWMPLGADARALPRGEGPRVEVVGRLKPGVGLAEAHAQFNALGSRLADAHPDLNEGLGLAADRFEDAVMPPQIVTVLWVMLIAVFGVLFIASPTLRTFCSPVPCIEARRWPFGPRSGQVDLASSDNCCSRPG